MSNGELNPSRVSYIYSTLLTAWEGYEDARLELDDATNEFLAEYAKYPDQLVVETLTKGTYVYKIVIKMVDKADYNGIAPALVKHDVEICRYYGSDVLVLDVD